MKKYFRRFIMIYLIALLALPAFGMRASAAAEKQVDILFLHDTHSHLNSFLTVEDGQDVTLGQIGEPRCPGAGCRRLLHGHAGADYLPHRCA